MFSLASKKAAFRYPLKAVPRVAVLVPWFRSKDAVRVFPHGWSGEAAEFAPQAIAGTREQLLSLAAHPPDVSHALIVLAQPGDPLLTPAEREQLWNAFEVPVFMQLVSTAGELLAMECEAHDGLHLCTTELSGYALDPTPCACGQASPRIIPKKTVNRAQSASTSAARAR